MDATAVMEVPSREREDLATDDKEVLEALVRHRSMPFLELESLVGIDEEHLRKAVDHLEERHFVKTDHRGDVFREIVTATSRAFEPVRY